MSSTTLVTGGSDGSVRVWSLDSFSPIHRLAAHDNSVTSLQFDDSRIVSGGSDGRVKVWDLGTGNLIRELSQPAEAVWRVAFENETAVVMASRGNRTIMEVWDFRPHEEEEEMGTESPRTSSAPAARDHVMLDVSDDAGREPSVAPMDTSYVIDEAQEGEGENIAEDDTGDRVPGMNRASRRKMRERGTMMDGDGDRMLD